MNRSLPKIMNAQLKKIIKDNNPYFTGCMDTENIRIWYIIVKNLPYPYISGQYLFKIEIPDNFPDEPPSLNALTPNGLMITGGKCCVSIGEFHSNDYRNNKKGHYGWIPSLGISGFILQGVVNALLSFNNKDTGVRLKNEPDDIKEKLAKESIEYNKKRHKDILELLQIHQECFPDLEVWKCTKT